MIQDHLEIKDSYRNRFCLSWGTEVINESLQEAPSTPQPPPPKRKRRRKAQYILD
jgi:hypothetical protein